MDHNKWYGVHNDNRPEPHQIPPLTGGSEKLIRASDLMLIPEEEHHSLKVALVTTHEVLYFLKYSNLIFNPFSLLFSFYVFFDAPFTLFFRL